MDDAVNDFGDMPIDARRAARDPEYRAQIFEEDPGRGNESEHIDWDQIFATTEQEEEAMEYAFDSRNYASEEAAMSALRRMIHDAVEEGIRDAAAAGPAAVPMRLSVTSNL